MGDPIEQAKYDREKFLGPILRAKDFVRCEDPNCSLNKTWARRCKQFGWTTDDYKPHCHPTF